MLHLKYKYNIYMEGKYKSTLIPSIFLFDSNSTPNKFKYSKQISIGKFYLPLELAI